MQSYTECIYRNNDETYFLSLDYLFMLKIEMLYFFFKSKECSYISMSIKVCSSLIY